MGAVAPEQDFLRQTRTALLDSQPPAAREEAGRERQRGEIGGKEAP